MCVLRMWTCGEFDGHMTSREINVEPGYYCVYEIASVNVEGERGFEGEIVYRNRVKVKGYEVGWVRDTSFHLDGIDKWFRQSTIFEWGKVEAIDIIPD